ncbi:MAG TPA: hypothetical protein VFT14_05970 [Solirubrobacterales bacterium]|nr:hypothetical protein [Solirubrobacterales bacterium]
MDDDLTPDERQALGRLPREAAPPPALEDATVAALTQRGLLRRAHRMLPIRPWLAIAASLLLFLGGLVVGRLGVTPRSAEDGRLRFALFLYEGPEYDQPPPDGMAQRVQEYVAWARERRENAVVEGGEKLRDDGDLAIEPDGRTDETAPMRGGTRLAGYFVVQADDRRAAAEIARTCPHVRYGGRIVIREIEPT